MYMYIDIGKIKIKIWTLNAKHKTILQRYQQNQLIQKTIQNCIGNYVSSLSRLQIVRATFYGNHMHKLSSQVFNRRPIQAIVFPWITLLVCVMVHLIKLEF